MNRWNLRIPRPLGRWRDATAFLRALGAVGGHLVVASQRRPWVTVLLPPGVAPVALPGVTEAEPDEPPQLLTPVAPAPMRLNAGWSWSALRVGVDQAHQVTRGQGVHIASIDTGFAPHPEFNGANIRTIRSVDASELTTPTDTNGHGIAVLGVMAAQGVNILGSAPGATYHSIKVSNEGLLSWVLLADGIDLAGDLGARIINLSWGGSTIAQVAIQAIDDFIAQGGLVVAAAGNNGSSNHADQSLRYPARLPQVIAVGASRKSDNRPAIPFVVASSLGSAWGPWPNSPDCIAPGDEVVVANRSGGYSTTAGTSFSTPLVAGLFALSMAAQPGRWNVSGTRMDPKYGVQLPARVVVARELLRDTCSNPGDSRDRQGYGLVNARAMVQAGGSVEPPRAGISPWLIIGGVAALGVVLTAGQGRR